VDIQRESVDSLSNAFSHFSEISNISTASRFQGNKMVAPLNDAAVADHFITQLGVIFFGAIFEWYINITSSKQLQFRI
jgi:hypothetical protein